MSQWSGCHGSHGCHSWGSRDPLAVLDFGINKQFAVLWNFAPGSIVSRIATASGAQENVGEAIVLSPLA